MFVTSVWIWNMKLLSHHINSAENLIKMCNGAQCECTVCQNNLHHITFITPFNIFVTTTLRPLQFLLIHNYFYHVELSILVSNFFCKFAWFFWYSIENKWNESGMEIIIDVGYQYPVGTDNRLSRFKTFQIN